MKIKTAFLGFIVILLLSPMNSFAQGEKIAFLLELNDDTINPVTAEYIAHAISKAENEKAECLIIRMDTPGGLLNSTRSIVKKILSSGVPIIVYVAPGGSRAGSAGVFITYASHIAAMAPSTNIGAAHPVQLEDKGKDKNFWEGLKELIEVSREKEPSEESPKASQPAKITSGDEKTQEKIAPDPDPMSSKILQDTVAFIKSLAEKRNRNVEWAIKSVVQSSSITSEEALNLKVIELIAVNEYDLLQKIDGWNLTFNSKEVRLETKDAQLKLIPMNARQKLFNILANPNIAYVLMILGFYGLLYEVTHPGFGVPGVLGTIFIILAFYSLQTLPTNYAGLALLILGLILLISEALTPGFGLLGAGGIMSLFLGSLLLFDTTDPLMKVSFSLILSFTVTTAAIILILVRAVIHTHRKKVLSGQEGLRGEKGIVSAKILPGQNGKISIHGEIWNAAADEPISVGEKVIVTQVDNMLLKVAKTN